MSVAGDSIHALIEQLWRELAANQANRALTVARVAANHGNAALKADVAARIRRSLPRSAVREKVLKLLNGRRFGTAIEMPDIAPPPPRNEDTIRLDPELGRLAIGLGRASALRVWAIGRQLVREGNGAGWVSKCALRAALKDYGVVYTREHVNRLLRGSRGVFWDVDSGRVYLRSWASLSRRLMRLALDQNPALVATNWPGARQMYVLVAGSLETWEAQLYAAWLAHRENPTIARETLEKLFGRGADTLRRWEGDLVRPRPNYAQCPDMEYWYDHIPEHAQPYVANVYWEGNRRQEVRAYWQMPNTYMVGAIRQHPSKSGARKVRGAVNAECQQPADLRHGGLPVGKLYIDQAKNLRRFLRKRGQSAKYLWRGENKRGQGMFEPNDSGFTMTYAHERASLKEEGRYFREWALKNLKLRSGIM